MNDVLRRTGETLIMMIGMTHRRMLQTTGGVMVAVYAAVMVLAVACAFGQATPTHAHHQQGDQSAHSALCLWACQANVGAGLLSAPDGRYAQSVALAHPLPLFFAVSILPIGLLHLRGPPLGYF
ncbi:MAG: hypothetical protein E8D45_00915 [Nitrospira sp.]|nr:MAG: hypothetical protein E8D45_00915 [Nitrospira sp.]